MKQKDELCPANWEIAVLALHGLGGASDRVHTEDIAIRCYKLAPGQFSWRKHPELPDCDIARVALSDARKDKNGALVSMTGPSEREGLWMLTDAGVRWIRARGEAVKRALGVRPSPVDPGKNARQYARRAIGELIRHPAFTHFRESGSVADVTEGDFVDSLRCTLNTPPTTLRARMDEAKTRATNLNEPEVVDYLDQCEKRFRHLL